jgi:hypothetical protein
MREQDRTKGESMAPSRKRPRPDSGSNEQALQTTKKAKRGFRLPGPQNLPDGPWRRKGLQTAFPGARSDIRPAWLIYSRS